MTSQALPAIALSTSIALLAPLAAAQSPSLFTAPTLHSVGGAPNCIGTADLDGDGLLDLAAASYFTDNASVLLGTSSGSFGGATNYAAGGTAPVALAMGDLDGDGLADLVLANSGSNSISVLRNLGAGSFVVALTSSVGGAPATVDIGDLDKDGHLDLVVSIPTTDSVSIFFGQGGGAFGPPATLAVGPSPNDVAVGDLDGDSFLDLAVANNQPATLSILFGQVNGTFAPAVNVGAGLNGTPFFITAGDIDGDSRLDLAAVDGLEVELLLNQGSGSFSAPTAYAILTGAPTSLKLADLDGDGFLDLAIGQAFSSVIGTRLGNGDGTFGAEVGYPAGESPTQLALADFSGDGALDMAATVLTLGVQGQVAVLHHQESNVLRLGTGTPGCSGAMMLTSSLAHVNSPSFTLFAGGITPSTLGLCVITDLGNASGSDPLGLGIALYVDLLTSSEIIALDASSISFDMAQVIIPIPNDPSLAGKTYYAQMVWQWTTDYCILPQTDPSTPNWANLATTNGLAITILP